VSGHAGGDTRTATNQLWNARAFSRYLIRMSPTQPAGSSRSGKPRERFRHFGGSLTPRIDCCPGTLPRREFQRTRSLLLLALAIVQIMLPFTGTLADARLDAPGRGTGSHIEAYPDSAHRPAHPDSCQYCRYLGNHASPSGFVVLTGLGEISTTKHVGDGWTLAGKPSSNPRSRSPPLS
jgi:hypothetical protein